MITVYLLYSTSRIVDLASTVLVHRVVLSSGSLARSQHRGSRGGGISLSLCSIDQSPPQLVPTQLMEPSFNDKISKFKF